MFLCYARIHSIKLCSAVGSSVEAMVDDNDDGIKRHCCPFAGNRLHFFFLSLSLCVAFFVPFSPVGIVALDMFAYRFSVSVGFSAHRNRIHFDSFVLLLDLLFSIDSLSMLFFLFFFRCWCWTVFLFISLSLHPERPCCTCAPIISLFMAQIYTQHSSIDMLAENKSRTEIWIRQTFTFWNRHWIDALYTNVACFVIRRWK